MKEATDGTMRLRGSETLSYSVGSMWKGLLEFLYRGWFQWDMEIQSLQGTQRRKEGRKEGKEGR